MPNAHKGLAATERLTRAVADAWRGWRERSEFAEFAHREPVEAARVAHDIGLSTRELVDVSSRTSRLDLLIRRMKRLGLDFESVSRARPEIARDLTICCARCESKVRCACDLSMSSDSDAWRKYCVNRETFDALAQR